MGGVCGHLGAARVRRRPRGEQGYSVVEAVITVPVMLGLTMLVVQYALLWHGRHVAEAAAQDGLRAARGFGATAAIGEREAADYLGQVAPRLLLQPTVQVERTATVVTVRVRAGVLSVVPGGGFTVEESAVGPVERFVGSRP